MVFKIDLSKATLFSLKSTTVIEYGEMPFSFVNVLCRLKGGSWASFLES